MIATFIKKLQVKVHSAFLKHKARLSAKAGKVKLVFLTPPPGGGRGRRRYSFFIHQKAINGDKDIKNHEEEQ